jgi:hydrogenase maturation protein HypF
MKVFNTQFKNIKTILALGAESAGNFSFYDKGKISFSEDSGDLMIEKNFQKFQKAVLDFIAKSGKPDVIISDMHPLFHTTKWGKELANNFDAEFVQVQHHLAHIYSTIGEFMVNRHDLPKEFIGIACDGTGYGFDEKVWGGEIFYFSNGKERRIGHLENQILIGGELAIKEPARILISILGKFMGKSEVYEFVKDFYNNNEYELLYNQWKEGFNCIETSSAGRVLDAASVLLGFSGNERDYKHAPIDLLEKNSSKSYEIEPEIREIDGVFILQTTSLFEYLVHNIDKDKKRLAATAQMYLGKGLWDICRRHHPEQSNKLKILFVGGVANNKIISKYLVEKEIIVSNEIPRGDAGISFGQITYYLANTGD